MSLNEIGKTASLGQVALVCIQVYFIIAVVLFHSTYSKRGAVNELHAHICSLEHLWWCKIPSHCVPLFPIFTISPVFSVMKVPENTTQSRNQHSPRPEKPITVFITLCSSLTPFPVHLVLGWFQFCFTVVQSIYWKMENNGYRNRISLWCGPKPPGEGKPQRMGWKGQVHQHGLTAGIFPQILHAVLMPLFPRFPLSHFLRYLKLVS